MPLATTDLDFVRLVNGIAQPFCTAGMLQAKPPYARAVVIRSRIQVPQIYEKEK